MLFKNLRQAFFGLRVWERVNQVMRRKSVLDLELCYDSGRICSIELMEPLKTSDRPKINSEGLLQVQIFKCSLKCNPQGFFQYCSRNRKVKEEDKCIENNKRVLLYANKGLADALNGYFVESFTR